MKQTIREQRRRQAGATGWKLAVSATASTLLLAACGGDGNSSQDNATPPTAETPKLTQPTITATVKPVIERDGYQFRDLNDNGELDVYEDWRAPLDARIENLVSLMTLEEKAGLMLIDTLNAGERGSVPEAAKDMVNTQKMSRFIFRSVVTATPASAQVTPAQAAEFVNGVQSMSEATRLGIPAIFKSNARNHYDSDPRVGINEAAGAFTQFPKEAGLAAAALGAGDMTPIAAFAKVMGEEWRSMGLRGMYGYMADLSTEPRWYRVHETFTEDADLNADIISTLVRQLQGEKVVNGTSVTPDSAVALTVKHFPGGGPQEMGLDPHYSHGKNQVYPGGNFEYHLKPFIAAINAGVSSIMPYYGAPVDVTYQGVRYEQVGMAFSKQIVTDLLRDKLGFQGYVNSDTGIITDRAWGLEKSTVAERIAAAVNGGTDTLSGFKTNQTITDLVRDGLLSEARVDEAAKRLLKEQFQLGLFENPYVVPAQATAAIGSDAHREIGMQLQRESIVLLQNQAVNAQQKLLPLQAGAKLYIMGLAKHDADAYGYDVTDGEQLVGGVRPSAAGHDYAVIRVEVSNNKLVPGTEVRATTTYKSDDPATGGRFNPATGASWGATDRCVTPSDYSAEDAAKSCLDNTLMFGGSFPWENGMMSFSEMAQAQSWLIRPSLSEIQAVMDEVGAEKTVLAIYFRQPYVLDIDSGLRDAGALVATFGVSNQALLDVLSGRVLGTNTAVSPTAKLPFALPNSTAAILNNEPDVPGYRQSDTLYAYGFGLRY